MVPPFEGVAVKVTFVLLQIELDGEATILKEAVTVGLAATVIEFEMAGLGNAHNNEEVISQVITSLLTAGINAETEELLPKTIPFLFH